MISLVPPSLLETDESASSAADWLHGFQPFSIVHVAVVLVTAAIVAIVVYAGRRWRNTSLGRRLDQGLAVAALVVWLVANGWWLLPQNLRLENSIPIHLSDVIGLCVPLALTVGWRPVRAILYFWGFGLTTQAYISPVVTDGPAKVTFWLFWLGHLAIITGAVYDVAVRRYRPTWRDYRTALLALVAYAAIALPIDITLGVNYGYLGRTTPSQPTLLNYLGSWPLRLLPMAVLAAIALALPMVPCVLVRRLRH